jgi:diguanylate cyclase (GGDEF)-like protein
MRAGELSTWTREVMPNESAESVAQHLDIVTTLRGLARMEECSSARVARRPRPTAPRDTWLKQARWRSDAMAMVPWLRRRLLWDARSADEAAMARAAIYLLALSGALGLGAAATMTAITGRLPAGALLPALGCAMIGAALLARFERLSREAIDAALACGTLLSATSLALAGDGGTGMEVYFLWAVLFAAFFFDRRRTARHIVLTGVAYSAALAAGEPAGLPVLRWVFVMTGVALVGVLVRLLRERADALNGRLAAVSRTDPQTSLLNRHGFLERLEEELARSRRSGRPVALLITDVDRLQALNDEHGHRAGDRVVAEIARTLDRHRRATDVVGRIGGDELAMILSETNEQAALIAAERLRRLATDALREQGLPATLSGGIAATPSRASTPEEVLNAAAVAVGQAPRRRSHRRPRSRGRRAASRGRAGAGRRAAPRHAPDAGRGARPARQRHGAAFGHRESLLAIHRRRAGAR